MNDDGDKSISLYFVIHYHSIIIFSNIIIYCIQDTVLGVSLEAMNADAPCTTQEELELYVRAFIKQRTSDVVCWSWNIMSVIYSIYNNIYTIQYMKIMYSLLVLTNTQLVHTGLMYYFLLEVSLVPLWCV